MLVLRSVCPERAPEQATLEVTRAMTRKAVRISEHGGLDRLELVDLEMPEPGPMEVRVRIRALALNHLDLFVRRGVPGHQFPLPLIPGSDGSGLVDALGPGVDKLVVGDEVVLFPGTSCGHCEACFSGRDQLCRDYAILGEARDGLATEYALVPRANVHPKPRGLGFVEAAAFALTMQTAWNMLVAKVRLVPGERVLIQAGGSGVGVACIQIAKLLGAEVWVTAGGGEKCKRCLELGADRAIDSTSEDFVAKVRGWTGGEGVEVVVDHVGQETFGSSIRCLGWGGRLVTCGATTGPKVQIHLTQIFFKSLSLLGSTMGSKGDLPRICKLVEQGRLEPVVGARLEGLHRYGEGQALLEERKVFGKVVVELP
jgi:NADPH:quinone reductase-like Zn-dependent oxidoreductase